MAFPGVEYIPVLAVLASLFVPRVTEMAKKKFGREEREVNQAHARHQELMEELKLAKEDLKQAKADAEKAQADEVQARRGEDRWRNRCRDVEVREVSLLRELAGKEILIDALTDSFVSTIHEQDAKNDTARNLKHA
jgi:hypothetical protein